jgi:hypothetical protein
MTLLLSGSSSRCRSPTEAGRIWRSQSAVLLRLGQLARTTSDLRATVAAFAVGLADFGLFRSAVPFRKPRWHPPAIAVLLPSTVTRWFPLMPDNHRSISGRSSWLRGLSEHKCDAADTMGAGLQGWKACSCWRRTTQLAALPFRGSAPVAKPAATSGFGASECPHPRLARHEWRSTRRAPPLCK